MGATYTTNDDTTSHWTPNHRFGFLRIIPDYREYDYLLFSFVGSTSGYFKELLNIKSFCNILTNRISHFSQPTK